MPLKKAMIIAERANTTDKIEVLFNPNQYAIEKSNVFSWKTVPGLSSPIGQFISGESSILSMELYFNTYEKKEDVRKYTARVMKLMEIDRELHAPPVCRFVWGSLDFKGYIEKVVQRFTMFLDSGIPVRATLNVSFHSYQDIDEQTQDSSLNSMNSIKQRILKQGENLWAIAEQEYGDSGLWRKVADANGIDDPLKLEAGRSLVIPPLED
ncbi:MAG TPA: LysM peptidoglycan-binding domain-containing protein [Clostridia bacterium]|nr:LysM peptidoglycan-binding domain-containing protein [Clostridia bacterium]